MLPFKISCLLAIINVNPDHFVHITPIARVKNCSLFELVKTNNQDQLKGDKIKPKSRHPAYFLYLRLLLVSFNSSLSQVCLPVLYILTAQSTLYRLLLSYLELKQNKLSTIIRSIYFIHANNVSQQSYNNILV